MGPDGHIASTVLMQRTKRKKGQARKYFNPTLSDVPPSMCFQLLKVPWSPQILSQTRNQVFIYLSVWRTSQIQITTPCYNNCFRGWVSELSVSNKTDYKNLNLKPKRGKFLFLSHVLGNEPRVLQLLWKCDGKTEQWSREFWKYHVWSWNNASYTRTNKVLFILTLVCIKFLIATEAMFQD